MNQKNEQVLKQRISNCTKKLHNLKLHLKSHSKFPMANSKTTNELYNKAMIERAALRQELKNIKSGFWARLKKYLKLDNSNKKKRICDYF